MTGDLVIGLADPALTGQGVAGRHVRTGDGVDHLVGADGRAARGQIGGEVRNALEQGQAPADLLGERDDGGNVDLDDLGAGLAQGDERGFADPGGLGIEVVPEVARGASQAHPFQVLDRARALGRVAGDHAVEQDQVRDGPSHRAGGVARMAQGHDPPLRIAAAARAKARHAAQRGGDADRSRGVGTESGRAAARRDRRRGSARAAARDQRRVVRIAHRPEGGVVGGDAERQLLHVGLAQDQRPGFAQAP